MKAGELKMNSKTMQGLMLALFATFVLAGCQSAPEEQEPPPPVEAPEESESAESEDPPTVTAPEPRSAEPRVDSSGDLLDEQGEPVTKVFYFEFDSSQLDSDARDDLRAHGNYLSNNSDARIVVYGHTDERGTREYNLALGERRAAAVRDYLQSRGASSGQIRIVSYGEERPVDPSSNESAWAKNRRAEIVYQ